MSEYMQFSIRLKESDRDKIKYIAENNSRTLNGQIEYLIRQAIKEYERVNNEIKVSEIKKGSKRLGLNIIIPSQNDSTVLSEDLIESADVVLADVPCSGFGVIRKKPEIRYKEQDSLTGLPVIQLKILTCLSQYVKPGGTLLYSTCTILKNENEDVINRFLENNNNYKLDAFTLPKFGDVNNGFDFEKVKQLLNGDKKYDVSVYDAWGCN